MVLNCDIEEDSWESLGLQGDPIHPSYIGSLVYSFIIWSTILDDLYYEIGYNKRKYEKDLKPHLNSKLHGHVKKNK